MSNFGSLKIQALSEINETKWNDLVDCLETVDDKIPDERWKFNDLIIDNDANSSALHIRSDGHRNSYITNRNNFIGNGTSENNDLYISSANKIHFQTGDADVNHGKNRLIINTNGVVRLSSDTGWMDIGSKNENWAHFYTDREKYYFDKEIRVDTGKIGAYNDNLQLCIKGNSKLTILKSNGNVGIGVDKPTQKLSVAGDINFNNHALIANYASQDHGGKNNIDHIWHKDQDNSWHFVSDNPYKAEGNAQLKAGSVYLKETGKSNYFGGKVGIGTATPSSKLQVVGSIHATRDLKVNNIVKAKRLESSHSHGAGMLKSRNSGHSINFQWDDTVTPYRIRIYVGDTLVKSIKAWGEMG